MVRASLLSRTSTGSTSNPTVRLVPRMDSRPRMTSKRSMGNRHSTVSRFRPLPRTRTRLSRFPRSR